MQWPKIAVTIPTYKRPDIVERCVDALETYLRYEGQLWIVVSEDGGDWHDLENIVHLNKRGYVTVIDGPSMGLGHNLNHLIRFIKDRGYSYMFQMDDDHILRKPLSLTEHIINLEKDPVMKYGWIRLMFGHSKERSVWPRDYYRFEAKLYKEYWRLKSKGDEFWVVSNRPHLKSVKFHDFYGMYPVNKKLGETELGFCRQWHDRHTDTAPGVFIPFIPPDEDTWDHIGDSWQKAGL